MAKYTVSCSNCESDMVVVLFGNQTGRKRKLENTIWICEECRMKEQNEQNEKARIENAQNDLPELIGTEKQIAWAETIRKKYYDLFFAIDYTEFIDGENIENRFFKKLFTKFKLRFENDYKNKIMCSIEQLFFNNRASFWIDNRNVQDDMFFSFLLTQIINEEKKIEEKMEKEIEEELVLSPENITTETIAKIYTSGDDIHIRFNEYSDTFRSIVKSRGYFWNHGEWNRQINNWSGPIDDRVIEIASILLENGYKVIVDECYIEKVKKSEYEPENMNWITYNITDKCFMVNWKSGDYNNEIKKIPSKRKKYNTYMVSPEHYKEIIDFAEINDFKLSEGANRLIEIEKHRKIEIIKPIKKEKIKKVVTKKLDVVTVLDELKDD